MSYAALVWGLPLVTGAGTTFLAAYVWRRRTVPGAYSLAFTLLCVAVWCATHGFEYSSTTLEVHRLWCHIQFPAIALLTLFFIQLAHEYTGRRIQRKTLLLIAVVPVLSILMHWTDAWTHLYWQSTWLDHSGPFTTLGRVYGPGFWIFTAYCYLLLIAAMLRLFAHARLQSGIARRRTFAFLISAALPWVVNVAYVLNLTPVPHFDLTPYAFVITGLGMTLAVFQYRFQSITPTAWKTVVESMSDCAIVIDTEGRVEDVNLAACEFLRTSIRQLVGQRVEKAFQNHPELLVLVDGPETSNRLVRTLAGVERTYQARGTPVLSRRKRETVGRLVMIRDITDETDALLVLRKAREAAEQAAVAKARFLATMSHEIRTPMNGVMGMADLLLNMELSDEQREYVVAILESGRSLLHILNDVLDYSKIEAGRLELENVSFSFPELLEEIRRLMEPLAQKRRLDLIVLHCDAASPRVMGDPGRVRQILVNLVGNGLKFTQKGSVTIELSTREMSDSTIEVSVGVRDTGIGIRPDRIEGLFEEFSQGDASTSRQFGGTGLGLAICRRLAAAMNAAIRVESAPGEGSLFTLHLTLKKAVGPVRVRTEVRGPTLQLGCRILLAEDNRVNQRVATRMLERLGCQVEVAEDGLAALRMVHQGVYDLIRMDCEMPVLDGLVTTMRLRSEGFQLPVIAITASVLDETREACLKAGMNDFLSKPIASEELAPLIQKWTQGTARNQLDL